MIHSQPVRGLCERKPNLPIRLEGDRHNHRSSTDGFLLRKKTSKNKKPQSSKEWSDGRRLKYKSPTKWQKNEIVVKSMQATANDNMDKTIYCANNTT